MTNRKTIRHCATALMRRCLWRVVRWINRKDLLSRAELEHLCAERRCDDLINEVNCWRGIAAGNRAEVMRLRGINERLRAIIRNRQASQNTQSSATPKR